MEQAADLPDEGSHYGEIVARRVTTITLIAGYVASLLAFSSAAVTAYWLLGGTALLDTLGGALERLARDRSTTALLLAVAVVVVKLFAGVFALVLLRRSSRRLAILAFAAGSLLAVYGAALTTAGMLVLIGVIPSTASTNEHALRWHALLWDPWFLAWGMALAIAGVGVRRATSRARGERPNHERLETAP